jgi:ankyrin repeat protein
MYIDSRNVLIRGMEFGKLVMKRGACVLGIAFMLVLCQFGQTVKLQLKYEDIDVNFKDEFGKILLLFALQNGHEAVVRLLLEHKDVDVNSKDYFWSSSASVGHEEGP